MARGKGFRTWPDHSPVAQMIRKGGFALCPSILESFLDDPIVPPNQSEPPQRHWGMIFEVRHGENVRLHSEKTVL
jgi:hypothetical protein